MNDLLMLLLYISPGIVIAMAAVLDSPDSDDLGVLLMGSIVMGLLWPWIIMAIAINKLSSGKKYND